MLFFRLGIKFIAQISKILKTIPFRNSQKIVLISLHKIGDTIFSFPTIRFFQEKYGKSLTIVCLKSAVELYKLLDYDVNIITVNDKNFYFGGRIAGFNSRKIISKLKPETIIDITGEINSVSLFSFRRVKNIYGRCPNYLKPFYDKNVFKEEKPSLSDRIFDVAKLIYSDAKISDYQPQPSMNHIVKSICIHPFAGWKAKEWNFLKFIKLAENLSKTYHCVIISESGCMHEELKNYIKETNIFFRETYSLMELIEEIKKCDLFIGNDSGPVYIASELAKKTFIIHGPTNPVFSTPKVDYIDNISKKLKCSPLATKQYCFTNAGRDGCPSFECMNQLSVSEVLEGVISLINK